MEELRPATLSFSQGIQKQLQASSFKSDGAEGTLKLPCHAPLPPLFSQKGMVKLPSFSFSFWILNNKERDHRLPPKPLLDIEDVRAFIRSKLNPSSCHSPNGHHHGPHDHVHGHHGPHGHVHGRHDIHQSGQSDGHVRHVSSGVFGIGTMGSSSSEGGYVRLSTQTHRDQQENPLSTLSNAPPSITHMNETIPDNRLLDIDDVRDFVKSFLHYTFIRRRHSTSWKNKMPWHVPRAPFLAKGLQWPPESFESETERKEFYRQARKRKPFLMGSPPLWTVTAFNLLFIQLLMFDPLRKFSNFLKSLP